MDRLMRLGMTIPVGTLSRWEEDALLVIREELDLQQAKRSKHGG